MSTKKNDPDALARTEALASPNPTTSKEPTMHSTPIDIRLRGPRSTGLAYHSRSGEMLPHTDYISVVIPKSALQAAYDRPTLFSVNEDDAVAHDNHVREMKAKRDREGAEAEASCLVQEITDETAELLGVVPTLPGLIELTENRKLLIEVFHSVDWGQARYRAVATEFHGTEPTEVYASKGKPHLHAADTARAIATAVTA